MSTKKMVRQGWPILLPLAALCGFGLIFIRSAEPGGVFFSNQVTWLLLAVLAGWMAACFLSTDRLSRLWLVAYAGALLLLVLVPLIGTEVNGARRWIAVGSILIQPSEAMKPALILALAAMSAKRWRDDWVWSLPPAVLVAPPLLLILLQPDLGTALAIVCVLIGMLLVSAHNLRQLVPLGLVGVACLAAFPFILRGYQRDRLVAFLDPYKYEGTLGYQAVQSFRAVGGGTLTGHGVGRGPLTQLGFIPDAHTDFVFSVVAEETGFLGAAALLLLQLILILAILRVAARAKDRFGRILATGSAILIFTQCTMNVGMTIGLTPVTGLTLPFVSYGGSSLVASFVVVGLALNVAREAP